MTPHQSRFSALLLCLTMLLPLSSCGKKPQSADPDALSIDSESIPSLNQILDGNDASFISADIPSSGGGGSRGENKSSPEGGTQPVYRFVYSDLPEGGKSVEAYMLGLIKDYIGFVIVNEEGSKDKAPDFYAEQGTLYLSRTNLRNLTELSMRLDWNKNQLMIRAWQQDLNTPFSPPETSADWALSDANPKNENAKKADSGKTSEVAPPDEELILTAQEGVDFLKKLSPVQVGLSGVSMKNYNVYYTEGSAKVDGTVCMRLHVYKLGDDSGTNVFLGTYLLATDASHLYRLEAGSSNPVEIPLV